VYFLRLPSSVSVTFSFTKSLGFCWDLLGMQGFETVVEKRDEEKLKLVGESVETFQTQSRDD
jgi:hypothetical protein